MFAKEIICDDIKLVKPDVGRDAVLAVGWLGNQDGIETLRLMGNVIKDDFKPSLKEEEERIRQFIAETDELNWMIEYKGKVVGSIWVALVDKNNCSAPSMHIMIGDKSARGKGIGERSCKLVVNYIKSLGHKVIYTRTLVSNAAAYDLMMNRLGFARDGDSYEDKNGLIWQNFKKQLK